MNSGSGDSESVVEDERSEGMSMLVVGAEPADGERAEKGRGEFGVAWGAGRSGWTAATAGMRRWWE